MRLLPTLPSASRQPDFLRSKIVLSLVLPVLGFAMSAQAGNIYKVVDPATGHVTYTDRPDNHQQSTSGPVQIIDTQIPTVSAAPRSPTPPVVPPSNAVTSNPNGANTASPLTVQSSTPPTLSMNTQPVSEAADYRFSMIMPTSEQVYRRPAQTIEVQLAISPALKPKDKVVITLDGKEMAQGLSASLPTVDLLPGEHQLQASLLNAQGKSIATVSQTLYILQTTQVLQQRKQIAKQLLAYQNLPWHQKLLLKLRQDNIPVSAIIPPKVDQVTDNTNGKNENKNTNNKEVKQAVDSAFKK
ncbi:MAG: DUF4124 domain-containing protein [Psychrobacter sp.]|nr:DUF4124 domain-containing protein [Psychrobacter sp.]